MMMIRYIFGCTDQSSRELNNSGRVYRELTYWRTGLVSTKRDLFFATLTVVCGRAGALDIFVGGRAGTFDVFVAIFSW